MAACTGLTIVKEFTYRGDNTEQWSNTYHLRGAPPGDDPSWKVLADDLIAAEKTCYSASTRVVQAWAYNDDSATAQAVWSHDYKLAGAEVPGTLPQGGINWAGDQAGVLWWRLDHRNSRGKPVYLRKYMHDGMSEAGDVNQLYPAYRQALLDFGTRLHPDTIGAIHGGVRARTGTWGVVQTGALEYVTTRTLKRRGKRPLPG